MKQIPKGIGHIGKEEYKNELQALVSTVQVPCDTCGNQYELKGGMETLVSDFDQEFICPHCKTQSET